MNTSDSNRKTFIDLIQHVLEQHFQFEPEHLRLFDTTLTPLIRTRKLSLILYDMFSNNTFNSNLNTSDYSTQHELKWFEPENFYWFDTTCSWTTLSIRTWAYPTIRLNPNLNNAINSNLKTFIDLLWHNPEPHHQFEPKDPRQFNLTRSQTTPSIPTQTLIWYNTISNNTIVSNLNTSDMIL